ncbi:acetylornithine deacetylase [Micrococcales bacterium 31B]|nr:acetylornithine deacetylase [Micrococcales bacterium 31B]
MTPASELRSWPWLEKLISFDTTSRDSNLPLIREVERALAQHGVTPQLVFNDEGTKANLIATFPAADGSTDGGIVISGHSDVVPVDGQAWETDPFTATVRGENIYGRGTCDMKGYLAAALAYLPEIADARLARPLHLAISYDEEIGCVGAVSLVKAFAEQGVWPKYCIVGEPTMMRVIAGHKAMNLMKATFHGVAAHSSRTPYGLNTIKYAAQFTQWFHALVDEFRTEGPFDERFDVPFSTGGVNVFDGGIAGNTVPERTEITFEFRVLAAHDPEALMDRIRTQLFEVIEPAMRAENPAGRVELELISAAPGLDTDETSEVLSLAAELGGELVTDRVNYGTEAGLFHNAGMQTIVCGPGDIAQAHAANEFVSIEQMRACERFMERLLESSRLV